MKKRVHRWGHLVGAVWVGLAAAWAVAEDAAAPAESRQAAVQHWISVGNEATKAARFEEAVDAFRRALELEPLNREARFGLGTTYIQRDQFREALDVLEPLLKEYPQDYFLKNNVAWLYATAKDHSVRNGEKALALAQEALLIAPRDYHVWSTLAEAYYVSGRYDRALRAAEEALRLGMEAQATLQNIREYRDQIAKCRRAAEAMSLVE